MNAVTSDKTMRDVVERELEWDAKLDATRIAVSATNGAVVLSGNVPTYADKWEATKAAERVYGVSAVADEIEVKLASSHERDDGDIAEEIAVHMRSSMAIPEGIKAEVKSGYVTLRGEVGWPYQSIEAERTLRYLRGVKGLNNLITIKPHGPKPADVSKLVSDAIERMAHVDARSVWVTSNNGTVHIHGHVHSFAEKRTAELAAASAPGVTHVTNDVFVTP